MAVVEDRAVVVDRGAGRGTSWVAWLALLLAIPALLLAWSAYDRTGGDLDERIREQVQSTSQTVEEGTQDAGNALDAGPDGVDEDDTDTSTGTGTDTQTDTTTDTNTTQ